MNINYFEGLMCVNYSLDDHEYYCTRSCKVHFFFMTCSPQIRKVHAVCNRLNMC